MPIEACSGNATARSGCMARDDRAQRCRRTRRATPSAPLDESTTGLFLDPADIVVERADFSAVASAIARLPERQREAIVLREFCGLSYEQVAAAMALSGSAGDSLLLAGPTRLVEQIGEIPAPLRGILVVPGAFREELWRA